MTDDEDAPEYKFLLRKFEEGTPSAFIALKKGLSEIWTQNSVTVASDRIATIKTVIRGESLSAFESGLEEARISTGDDGVVTATDSSNEHIEVGLAEIAKVVFPCRALETQSAWSHGSIKKPHNVSIRQFVTAIVRINDSSPLFPQGSESGKISDDELLEIFEHSIPDDWK